MTDHGFGLVLLVAAAAPASAAQATLSDRDAIAGVGRLDWRGILGRPRMRRFAG
jgi:hypothetical protein